MNLYIVSPEVFSILVEKLGYDIAIRIGSMLYPLRSQLHRDIISYGGRPGLTFSMMNREYTSIRTHYFLRDGFYNVIDNFFESLETGNTIYFTVTTNSKSGLVTPRRRMIRMDSGGGLAEK